MKKIIITVLAIAALVFTGCKNNQTPSRRAARGIPRQDETAAKLRSRRSKPGSHPACRHETPGDAHGAGPQGESHFNNERRRVYLHRGGRKRGRGCGLQSWKSRSRQVTTSSSPIPRLWTIFTARPSTGPSTRLSFLPAYGSTGSQGRWVPIQRQGDVPHRLYLPGQPTPGDLRNRSSLRRKTGGSASFSTSPFARWRRCLFTVFVSRDTSP